VRSTEEQNKLASSFQTALSSGEKKRREKKERKKGEKKPSI